MGTIVTVHGTFAQGPDVGPNWWQQTSHFEKELRNLVEATNDELKFVPHGWTGLNSERSRRAAGKALLKRLQGLEAESQSYCLIGHSHGGSVIMHALAENSRMKRRLNGLSRWITVGTPFISFREVRTVLSKFGMIGKAAYIMAVTLVLLDPVSSLSNPRSTMNYLGGFGWLGYLALPIAIIFMIDRLFAQIAINIRDEYRKNLLVKSRSNNILPHLGPTGSMLYFMVLAFALFWCFAFLRTINESAEAQYVTIGYVAIGVVVLLFLAFDLCLRYIVKRFLKRKTAIVEKFYDGIARKWTAFMHPHDEAINGLVQLRSIRFRIFGSGFCVDQVSVFLTFLLPALILFAFESPTVMAWISAKSGLPVTTGVERFRALLQGPWLMLINRSADLSNMPVSGLVLAILIPFSVLCIAYVAVARAIAFAISWSLSVVLNHAVWNQIRSSSCGSDVIGETWTEVAPVPGGSLIRRVLPNDLASEITYVADNRALGSIRKLRSSMNSLVFRENERDQTDILKEYLTGDELIHTSYFSVRHFNMLIAYAISQSPGFKPSAQFLDDPDYELIANWFKCLADSTPALEEVRVLHQ